MANHDIEYFFDVEKCNRYELLIKQHTIVRECVEFLVNVSTSGIEVHDGYFDNRFIDDVIVPFLRHAIRSIITAGWFQYKYVKKPHLHPIVVPFHFTRPKVVISKKTYEAKFMYSVDDGNEYKPYGNPPSLSAIFMYDMGSYMNQTCMSTPVDAFYYDYDFLMIRKKAGLRADIIRSCPTVYLNRIVKKDSTGGGMGLAGLECMNVVGGPGATTMYGGLDRLRAIAASDDKNTSWKKLSEEAHFDIDANIMFHEHQSEMHRITAREDMFAPQYENNVYIPPPEKELAGVPHLPQPVTDLLKSEIYLNSTIYKAFGVSRLEGLRGLSMSDRNDQNKSQDQNLDILEFITTLERYHAFVVLMIQRIHRDVFSEEINSAKIKVTAYRDLLKHVRPKLYEENENK